MKRGLLLVLAAAVAVVSATPGTASAHAALESSSPSEDTTVDEPVEEITLTFTEAVTPVGNGFEILDPQGDVVIPTAVTDDDTVFRLVLDEPLANGEVGVVYEVTSADGHVVSGGFAFRVDAPAPTTAAPTVPPTTVPVTTIPEPSTTVSTPVTTTGGSIVTPTSSTSSVPAETSTAPADGDTDDADDDAGDDPDEGGSTGLVVAVVLGVVIAVAAVFLARSRSTG